MSKNTEFPVCRNLDGVFFHVTRDGKPACCCFSDLTESEQTGYNLSS